MAKKLIILNTENGQASMFDLTEIGSDTIANLEKGAEFWSLVGDTTFVGDEPHLDDVFDEKDCLFPNDNALEALFFGNGDEPDTEHPDNGNYDDYTCAVCSECVVDSCIFAGKRNVE